MSKLLKALISLSIVSIAGVISLFNYIQNGAPLYLCAAFVVVPAVVSLVVSFK